MSSSGPHLLFLFLFPVAVAEAGFPGAAGVGTAGQVRAGTGVADGASGGLLSFRLGSGAVRAAGEAALAFRNSSSFCR